MTAPIAAYGGCDRRCRGSANCACPRTEPGRHVSTFSRLSDITECSADLVTDYIYRTSAETGRSHPGCNKGWDHTHRGSTCSDHAAMARSITTAGREWTLISSASHYDANGLQDDRQVPLCGHVLVVVSIKLSTGCKGGFIAIRDLPWTGDTWPHHVIGRP